MSHLFRIAAVQACPVYMDREATIAKACHLIAEAGAAGAKLAVFPEAFVPGYPLWVWFIPAGHTHPLREVYAEFVANAVAVPGKATAQLCEAAKKAEVAVAIGINEVNIEASGSTVYNTLLYIAANGTILGKHRKMMPTGGEKLVWGMGDGSDLEVYDLPFGRVGGLICWENYMPLARYAMAAWGTEIFVAPTWDRGEPWLSTVRHVAKEGRCYVVGCCAAMHKDDVPDRFAFKEKYLGAVEGWINPGDSVIVDPDGKMVAGPASQKEEILYAELDRAKITGPRWQLDVAGHYARPDIFELIVHRRPKPLLSVSLGQDSDDRNSARLGDIKTASQQGEEADVRQRRA
ncbi:MAG TPA: carbon-nitrogen hydrolase family protein [Bryobacteraceae bacterium]|nr:carbon-nitrogen hydrolase family protein [Bryobacteraceae bacterium]